MRSLLLFLALLATLGVQSQSANFTDLKGRWKESARYHESSGDMEFTDTLQAEFTEEGFCQFRYHNGPTFVGEGELKGETLRFKGKTYSLRVNNLTECELREGPVKHTLRRVGQFAPGVSKLIVPGEESGPVKVDQAALQGKWTVYRKTDPAFQGTRFYIRHLEIRNNLQSALVTYNNMDSVFSAERTMEVLPEAITLRGEGASFEKLRFVKSDGQELILKDGNIVYYLKRFGGNR